MKKSTIAVIAALVALAIALVALIFLNMPDIAQRQQLRTDEVFLIIIGEDEHRVTINDIENLYPRAIEANYKRSGRPAETRMFSGVPFAAILELHEIDSANLQNAIFAAADGYQSALTISRALNDAYIVLCDERGPFRMILPNDQFSQHWCSYLTDVTLR